MRREDRFDRRGKMTEARPRFLTLFDNFGLMVIYGAARGSHVTRVVANGFVCDSGYGTVGRYGWDC